MAIVAGAEVGRRIPIFERWLSTLAALLNTDAALIILSHEGLSRIIASYGMRHPHISWRFDFARAPYGPHDTVLEPDATNRADLHAFLGVAGLNRTRFFYRRPIPFEGAGILGLVAYGLEARPGITKRQLRLVDEIVKALAQEFAETADHAELLPGAMGFELQGLVDWVENDKSALAVLDHNLLIIHANDAMQEMGPTLAKVKKGDAPFDMLPAVEFVRPLMMKALASGESSPEIETRHDDPATGQTRYITVMASPVHIANAEHPVLLVSLTDITREVRLHVGFEDSTRPPTKRKTDPAAATVGFLTETLVRRRSLRSRNGISYLTIRAWREPIRDHQIKALRLLKAEATPRLASSVALEFRDEIEALMGLGGFRAVVPVPCGKSPPGQCLSRHIGLELSYLLGVPLVEALKLPQMEGSSHPKTNLRRHRMSLLRPPEGPVVVVDDVATSGMHIEEACRLLRGAGIPVLGLAWIGGNAGKDD